MRVAAAISSGDCLQPWISTRTTMLAANFQALVALAGT